MQPSGLRLIALSATLALSLFTACKSAEAYRDQADNAVYAILEQRRNELFQHTDEFSIDPPADSLRQRLLRGETVAPLTLIAAIDIAAENSRDYQAQKESLYLAALDLTLARYAFQVQTRGTLGALLEGDAENGATDASADGSFRMTKLLGTGALIVGDIGLGIARTLTFSDGWDITSTYNLAVTQPLLRGFGERIVKEPLTQAERNVVYEVRSFERFRSTFAVEVASRYYRILQQHDQVGNEERNYANLLSISERNAELAEAGRLSDIDLGQARQDELRSKNTLVEQRQRLETLLDAFKLFLGLPIEAQIDLTPEALNNLTYENAPLIEERVAIDAALRQRLDYMTALDRTDDRERQTAIAADALRAGLDVTAAVHGSSIEGQPLDFERVDQLWTLSLDMDLPIDRLQERNAYREALITYQRTLRDAEELADNIIVELRASLREAIATLETLEIQRNAASLAERRVESARMNLEAGRSSTRDILEAQDALVEAQNAVTAARINHHLARLALWRDAEALRIDENGITLQTEFASAEANP